MSSVVFIFLSIMDLLPGINEEYVSFGRGFSYLDIYTNPWNSLQEIWLYVFIYLGEVFFCYLCQLIAFGISRSFRYIKGSLD